MVIESARAYFERLTVVGHVPRLRDAVGVVEVDVEGAGIWFLAIEHGELKVSETADPASPPRLARLACTEADFLRMVRGEDHENLITAFLRGALDLEGDPRFVQRLQSLIPFPDEAARGAMRSTANSGVWRRS